MGIGILNALKQTDINKNLNGLTLIRGPEKINSVNESRDVNQVEACHS